jgi:hypothetical protein
LPVGFPETVTETAWPTTTYSTTKTVRLSRPVVEWACTPEPANPRRRPRSGRWLKLNPQGRRSRCATLMDRSGLATILAPSPFESSRTLARALLIRTQMVPGSSVAPGALFRAGSKAPPRVSRTDHTVLADAPTARLRRRPYQGDAAPHCQSLRLPARSGRLQLKMIRDRTVGH